MQVKENVEWAFEMTVPLVTIGKILIVLGAIMIPFGFIPQPKTEETTRWDLMTTQAAMTSFSIYLQPGQYQLYIQEGALETGKPPILYINDSAGDTLYRFETGSSLGTQYINITSYDNYQFTFYNITYNFALKCSIAKQVTFYYTYNVYPYTFVSAIGAIVSLTGLGTLICGLIVRKRMPQPQSSSSVQR